MAKSKIEDILPCDNVHKFANNVILILPYSGFSESKFFLCIYNNVRFLVKLSLYKKSVPKLYLKNLSNMTPAPMNQYETEVAILEIFKKEVIYRNKTPCILELVIHKKCKITNKVIEKARCDNYFAKKTGKKLTLEDVVVGIFCNYNEMIESELGDPQFSYLVLEECETTFRFFLSRYHGMLGDIFIDIFRSLLFQIVFTIYKLKEMYPSFHHWDLHGENVMIKKDSDFVYDYNNPQFMVFPVEGKDFYVPYYGLICKIIDFGFSSLKERGIVSDITLDKDIMYYKTDNDLLLLYYSIYESTGANEEITKILAELDPKKTFANFDPQQIRKMKDTPSYKSMVLSKAFSQYRRDDIQENQVWHRYSI